MISEADRKRIDELEECIRYVIDELDKMCDLDVDSAIARLNAMDRLEETLGDDDA